MLKYKIFLLILPLVLFTFSCLSGPEKNFSVINKIITEDTYQVSKNTSNERYFFTYLNSEYDSRYILQLEDRLIDNIHVLIPNITPVSEILKNFENPPGILIVKEADGSTHLSLHYGGLGLYCGTNEILEEIRMEDPVFPLRLNDKLYSGAPMENIFAFFGQPDKTIKGGKIGWQDKILYIDVEGKKGYGYIDFNFYGVRFFILDYKIKAMYIYKQIKW